MLIKLDTVLPPKCSDRTSTNMLGLNQILPAMSLLLAGVVCQHGGYHYNSFSGPVSGEARQIQVPVGVATHQHPAQNHGQTVDYVAKPDYTFAYGVEDPHTGNTQKHKESRDGDVVRGQYIVLQPDGSMRTVTYTADDRNGFQATVHNTAPTIPQPQYAINPTPQHNNNHNNNQNNNNNNNNNNQRQYNNYDY